MLYGIIVPFDQTPFSNDAELDALDDDALDIGLRAASHADADTVEYALDLTDASLPTADPPNGVFAERLVYG